MNDEVVRELRGRGGPAAGPGEGGRHRGSAPRSGRPPRGRPRSSLIVAVTIAVLVLVAVWATHGRRPPAVAEPPATPVAPGWTEVLAALDDARLVAFAAGDADALRAADAAGSAAARADRAVVGRMRHDGVRPRGLRLELVSVGFVRSSSAAVRLRVVDRRSAYTWVDGGGRTVRSVPARAARAWWVDLRSSGRDWRIAAVRPIGPEPVHPSASAAR